MALEKYAAAIQEIAKARSLEYVDLLELTGKPGMEPVAGVAKLTENGLHYSPYGQWRIAPLVAKSLKVTGAGVEREHRRGRTAKVEAEGPGDQGDHADRPGAAVCGCGFVAALSHDAGAFARRGFGCEAQTNAQDHRHGQGEVRNPGRRRGRAQDRRR